MSVAERGGSIVPIADLDVQPLEVEIPATLGAERLAIERIKNPALVATVVKGTNTMWANVWGCSPVTAALTMRILPLSHADSSTRQTECVELACGCAIPSLAAARAGARVLATDVTSMALRLLEHNAALNTIATATAASSEATAEAAAAGDAGILHTSFLNVSDEPDVLMERLGEAGWTAADVVVASEVMFLSSMQRPVARTTAALLRPGGLGLVVDAMRPSCEGFEGKCEDCGLGSLMVESGPIVSNGIVLPGCRAFILFPLSHTGASSADAPVEAASSAGALPLDLARVCVTGCAPGAVPSNAAAAMAAVLAVLDALHEQVALATDAKKGYCV
jgi:hypothetical protein